MVASGSIAAVLTTPGRAKKSFSEFDRDAQDAWDDGIDDDVAAVARSFSTFSTPAAKTSTSASMTKISHVSVLACVSRPR